MSAPTVGHCKEPLDVDQAVLLDLLVAQLTDFAIFVTDCDGCIQTWNPGVSRILGYSESEWLGQSIDIIFTPEDRLQERPQREMELAATLGCCPDVRWHQRRDESQFFVEGSLVGLRDGSGKLLGFSKIIRDTTERKNREIQLQQTEERLQSLSRELQRSNEELAQFAHMVSHDLQTPLRGVSTFGQLLKRNSKDRLAAEDVDLLDHIIEGARGMQSLVNAFLKLAQVEQGEIESKCVEMGAVLESTLQVLKPQMEEARAIITHASLPTVKGDFIQLAQLLQNLIGNAIKYGRPGEPPCIHIEVRREDKACLFMVQDNGEGIPRAHLQSIFKPLKRLHGDDIPGTGLGLALCQRIVNRHGGEIWAESPEESGAVFYFRLPSL